MALELLFNKVVAFTEDECDCEPTADEPCTCRDQFAQIIKRNNGNTQGSKLIPNNDFFEITKVENRGQTNNT